VFAVHAQAHPDDDAILCFVIAVDDAKDEGSPLASSPLPSQDCRERAQALMRLTSGRPPKLPNFPECHRLSASATTCMTDCSIASGEKLGSSSAASTAA
jgi:hypothetical protein